MEHPRPCACSADNDLIRLDGTSETGFDLPRFDFDWQRFYFLAEPKWVPEGTVAEFIGTWDNSAANANNPDPSQRVLVGPKTNDEMFNLRLGYTADVKLSNTYIVEQGRVVDSHENSDPGRWVIFWNQVVDRAWLEDKVESRFKDLESTQSDTPSEFE